MFSRPQKRSAPDDSPASAATKQGGDKMSHTLTKSLGCLSSYHANRITLYVDSITLYVCSEKNASALCDSARHFTDFEIAVAAWEGSFCPELFQGILGEKTAAYTAWTDGRFRACRQCCNASRSPHSMPVTHTHTQLRYEGLLQRHLFPRMFA